ncbi:amidohydrolase family protein [Catellatospora sichuanensis]|uniref:amidohydrolase family protein n=1 Tax=Catellatospora sichuanensis TaxID=1969805 RepID=UPI001183FD06|nr:amidohydrolase family protein [Catellatospora sichuanensis]
MTGGPLLLRAALLADGRRVDVRVQDGLIARVDPAGTGDASGTLAVDLAGHLLLPAPAEIHAHLDKALSADAVPNPAGDLFGAVTAWLAYRPSLTREQLETSARAALDAYLGHGATAVRTHADLGEGIGLRALQAVLAVRDDAAGCTVQVTAFAATPLTGAAGAVNRALLADALAAGADAVGACPGLDPDPAGCIEICLALAARHGVPLDLHVDEWLHPDPCSLELLADAVTATGFPHGVLAGHCVSLGMMDPDQAGRIADKVARAGIAVACLPQTNLFLQGRDHERAVPRGLTALRTLRAAGVTVAAGGDNLQDPFQILGRGDPLETAALLVLAGHDTPETAYDAVSAQAREAAGLPPVTVAPGSPAELLAVRAGSLREALATATAHRLVIHDGRIVARTTVTRHDPDDHPAQIGHTA